MLAACISASKHCTPGYFWPLGFYETLCLLHFLAVLPVIPWHRAFLCVELCTVAWFTVPYCYCNIQMFCGALCTVHCAPHCARLMFTVVRCTVYWCVVHCALYLHVGLCFATAALSPECSAICRVCCKALVNTSEASFFVCSSSLLS